MKRIAGVSLALLVSLGVISCSDNKETSAGDATARALKGSASGALLEYVPADTPYFVGSLAPMDDDVMASLRAMNEEVLKGYGKVIRSAIDSADNPDADEMAPIAEKLASYFEDGKLDELGIGEGVTGGLYGVGLLPVLRVSLEDPAAFEKGVAELETSAGTPMETATIDGVTYRYASDDEARFVIANESGFAVATILPAGASDDVLKQVLGLTKPSQTLSGTDKIETLSTKHGMLPQGLGFIDLIGVSEVFLSEQRGVNAELLAMADYDPDEISDVCKTEIREMAGVMPQIDFGYTRIEKERFDLLTVVNLRSDLARSMQSLAAAVPGLGGAMEGLMAFGFSVDLPAAREFVSERAAALEADPFECEYFFDLQDSVAQMEEAASQPLPPVADSLRGAKVIIDSMDDFDIAGGAPPSIAGRAIIAVQDAPSLLLMGQMVMPQLFADLELEPNGEVVELPMGTIPGSTDPAFVALTNDAIAIGIGADSGAGLAKLFDAPVATAPPLMGFSYDVAGYMGMLGDVIRQTGQQDADVDTEAVTEMFEAMQKYLDRTWFDLRVTDAGIEMPYVVTLK